MGRNITSKSSHHNTDTSQGSAVERMIFLTGEIEEYGITNAIANIIALGSQSSAPIDIVMSTYGGNVHDAFALYDAINIVRNVNGCDVRTTGLGKVMSAGVMILAAGTPGKRFLGESTTIMMHPVSTSTGGNAIHIAAELQEMVRLQDRMDLYVSRHSKLTPEDLKNIMRLGHDHNFDASTAVKYGLADAIIGVAQQTPAKKKAKKNGK